MSKWLGEIGQSGSLYHLGLFVKNNSASECSMDIGALLIYKCLTQLPNFLDVFMHLSIHHIYCPPRKNDHPSYRQAV